MDLRGWQPINDQVFIERLEPMIQPQHGLVLTDQNAENKPILRKGRVLACGPGKWIEGTWWYLPKRGNYLLDMHRPEAEQTHEWRWLEGYREQLDVKPGMTVLFNARWNDLAHGELRGTGADKLGPLERPLSYKFDPTIHLVQEADIAGILG